MLHTNFEVVACQTWQTLRDAIQYRVSQGEETITDNLLLYLLRQKLSNIRLVKTPKDKEAMMGTDWEWWIGSRTRGFVRYALQAKKLNSETHRYHTLRHDVLTPRGSERQDAILKRYAHVNAAIPIYALYNFVDLPDFKDYWNCPLPLDVNQFGITVTPLKNIEDAIAIRGQRSFESLHGCADTIPLRCLASCPKFMPYKTVSGVFKSLMSPTPIKVYTANELGKILNSEDFELEEFPESLYSAELGIYPRRIAVAETDD